MFHNIVSLLHAIRANAMTHKSALVILTAYFLDIVAYKAIENNLSNAP